MQQSPQLQSGSCRRRQIPIDTAMTAARVRTAGAFATLAGAQALLTSRRRNAFRAMASPDVVLLDPKSWTFDMRASVGRC